MGRRLLWGDEDWNEPDPGAAAIVDWLRQCGVTNFCNAHLRRLRSRLGAPKAITAAAHKLARIFYTVLRYGVAYQKRSEEEFVVDHQKRMEKSLHRRAKELGYELRKVERPAEAEPQLA